MSHFIRWWCQQCDIGYYYFKEAYHFHFNVQK